MMVLKPRPLDTRADVRALLDDLVDEIRDAVEEIKDRLEEEETRGGRRDGV